MKFFENRNFVKSLLGKLSKKDDVNNSIISVAFVVILMAVPVSVY
jgi:hypothetical protein